MKYYVEFTLVDTTTKEKKVIKSDNFADFEKADNIMQNYLKKQKNFIDIKFLGCNKVKVEKFGGYVMVEIIEN